MSIQHLHRPSQPLTMYLVYVYVELDPAPEDRRVAYYVTPFTTSRERYCEILNKTENAKNYAFGDVEALGALFEGEHPKWFNVFCSDEGAAPIGSKLALTRAMLPHHDSFPEEALNRWFVANNQVAMDARCKGNRLKDKATFTGFLIDSDNLSNRLKHALMVSSLVVDINPAGGSADTNLLFPVVKASVEFTLSDAKRIGELYIDFCRWVEQKNAEQEGSQMALERELNAAWESRDRAFDPQEVSA